MSNLEYLMNTHSILPMKQPQRPVGIELTLSVMHRKDYNRIFWMHLYQLFEQSKYFLHNSRSTKHMDISFKLELHFLSNPIRIKCILHYNYYLKYIKLKIAMIDLYYLIVFPFEVSRIPQQLLQQKPSKHHNFLDPLYLLRSLSLSNPPKLELLIYQPRVSPRIPFANLGQFAKTTNLQTILKSSRQNY